MRSFLLSLLGGALVLAPRRAPDLPAQLLPVNGGSGGTAYSRDCGAGRVVTGLRMRSALLVDAVGLLCKPVGDEP